jgi:DNA helicase-2/ATP-dependent DNA helicase PcrA
MSLSATLANHARPITSETARSALRIVAPDSERVTSLVERAIDLIQNHGATPESLLVVTSTDSVAREFALRTRNRLNSLGIKINPNVMYAGTWHSICLRLLDEHREFTGMKRNYTVMDQFDQHYFLYQRLKNYRAIANSELVTDPGATRWKQAQNLLERLNAATEQALDANAQTATSDPHEAALLACHKLYLEQLKKANALDLVTIQLTVLRLLDAHPQMLAALRNRLAYLLADDLQETGAIAQRIFRRLLSERPGSRIVGGGEQVHYRFRDAADQPPVGVVRQAEGAFYSPGRPPSSETIPWWLM